MSAWEREVDAVRSLVLGRTGITEAGGRDVARGMLRRMRAEHEQDPAAYAARVATDDAVFDALVHELTVGETYFLREPEQLEYVRREVLPPFAADRDSTRPLRVWSAGCATGEETYTLAILLSEAGLHDRSRVIGTDIAAERLRRARHGSYGRWSFRAVPDTLVQRWFSPARDGFRVAAELRELVDFRRLNLLDDDWASAGIRPASVDLLLCRNVLIYLDPDIARRIARRFVDVLAPGGWLLLGASDPWLSGIASLEAVPTGAGVIYRKPLASTPSVRVPMLRSTRPSQPRPPSDPAVRDPIARDGAPTTDVPDGNAATAAGGREAVTDAPDDATAAIGRIREFADRGELKAAERACAAAIERDVQSAELRALQALLLAEAGHVEAAIDAARAALYLDPRLIPAHLALGGARTRLGRRTEAAAAFRSAERLLADIDVAQAVPGAGGALAGELAELARTQIRLLEERVNEEAPA